MKGLLYKDLYATGKYYRNLLILACLFLALSWFDPENLFFLFYPCLMSGMITVSLISLDEKEGWDNTCGFLPFTDWQLVGTKYLMALLFVLVFLLAAVGVQATRMLVVAGGLQRDFLCFVGGSMISFGLISPAVMLPLIYRFGSEKGRIVYLFVVGGMAGILVFLSSGNRLYTLLPVISVGGIVPAVMAIFGASYLLSVRICGKRK